MRIPYAIDRNTINAYRVPSIYLRKERVKPDDFTWDSQFAKSLREMCLITIAENWEKNQIYNALQVPADKLQLLELLSTDLPIELTVPLIEEDFYWERCYKARWPDAPEPKRRYKYDTPINVYCSRQTTPEQLSEQVEESQSEIPEAKSLNYSEKEINMYSYSSYAQESNMQSLNTIYSTGMSSRELKRVSAITVVIIKSWKQIFLEKFLEGELERMKPDMFNPEYIKELTDLYGLYISCLNIKQLQACKNEGSYDHISLHSLLARLPQLIEFSVCFNQANLCDNFKWHATKVSETDCELLGNGVEKSQLKILRVLRSDIDGKKVKLLLKSLCAHNYLLVLDLSHCKISDEGAKAVAGFLKQNKILEKLILVNNKIGPAGAQGLGFYLSQLDCKLIELNLKLNPLNTEGGKFIATALARGANTLRNLNLSSCGLTTENLHIGLALALNNTLQKLDLSNNLLGEESAPNLLTALEKNTTLIHLDLRMCGLLPETVQEIQKHVRRNLENYRLVLVSPPCAEHIL